MEQIREIRQSPWIAVFSVFVLNVLYWGEVGYFEYARQNGESFEWGVLYLVFALLQVIGYFCFGRIYTGKSVLKYNLVFFIAMAIMSVVGSFWMTKWMPGVRHMFSFGLEYIWYGIVLLWIYYQIFHVQILVELVKKLSEDLERMQKVFVWIFIGIVLVNSVLLIVADVKFLELV